MHEDVPLVVVEVNLRVAAGITGLPPTRTRPPGGDDAAPIHQAPERRSFELSGGFGTGQKAIAEPTEQQPLQDGSPTCCPPHQISLQSSWPRLMDKHDTHGSAGMAETCRSLSRERVKTLLRCLGVPSSLPSGVTKHRDLKT